MVKPQSGFSSTPPIKEEKYFVRFVFYGVVSDFDKCTLEMLSFVSRVPIQRETNSPEK